MAFETIYKVSRNGSLPGSGHRLLDWTGEVSWRRIWCSDRISLGRASYWELLSRSRLRPSQIDDVSSIPFRNRLLTGAQLFSKSERRRLALGRARSICSRHWPDSCLYGRPFLEARPGLCCRFAFWIIDRVARNRH